MVQVLGLGVVVVVAAGTRWVTRWRGLGRRMPLKGRRGWRNRGDKGGTLRLGLGKMNRKNIGRRKRLGCGGRRVGRMEKKQSRLRRRREGEAEAERRRR